MGMTKTDLLKQIMDSVSEEEWKAIDEHKIIASDFNYKNLSVIRNLKIGIDSEIDEDKLAAMIEQLNRFLEKELSDKPEAWKWIHISCIYLGFIAERPLHPIDLMHITQINVGDDVFYECPMKDTSAGSMCNFCVCRCKNEVKRARRLRDRR